MNALCRLFDQYKAQAGYPDAELEIRWILLHRDNCWHCHERTCLVL
jgi:hypothetical protein